MIDQSAEVATLVRQMGQVLAAAQASRADLRAVIAAAQRIEAKTAGLLADLRAARA